MGDTRFPELVYKISKSLVPNGADNQVDSNFIDLLILFGSHLHVLSTHTQTHSSIWSLTVCARILRIYIRWFHWDYYEMKIERCASKILFYVIFSSKLCDEVQALIENYISFSALDTTPTILDQDMDFNTNRSLAKQRLKITLETVLIIFFRCFPNSKFMDFELDVFVECVEPVFLAVC